VFNLIIWPSSSWPVFCFLYWIQIIHNSLFQQVNFSISYLDPHWSRCPSLTVARGVDGRDCTAVVDDPCSCSKAETQCAALQDSTMGSGSRQSPQTTTCCSARQVSVTAGVSQSHCQIVSDTLIERKSTRRQKWIEWCQYLSGGLSGGLSTPSEVSKPAL